MKKILDLIKGGVAKKDLTPILTHLRIQHGWVTSTNGRLTVSSPIPGMDKLDIIVPAGKFITAIKTCKDPKFKITPTGKLSITDKGFKALLPLMTETVFPTPITSRDEVESSDLIPAIKKLLPFIGTDASRPWSCGVLLYDNMAYATNNVLLAECLVQWSGPAIVLPAFLIDELIRLKKEVLSIRTAGDNITLELDNDVWINSVLVEAKWPNIIELFEKIDFTNIEDVNPELRQAVLDIMPFCPDPKFPKMLLTEDGVSTEDGVHQASVSMEGLVSSVWRAEQLLLLLDTGRRYQLKTDFSNYPKPCPWAMTNGVRGVIIGLK